MLKALTRLDPNKVFRKRKLQNEKLALPTYKFMTDTELKEAIKNANDKVHDLLQMPPVVKVREAMDNILEKNPALKGLDTAKFVFTDISLGVKNYERLIVVREPDGTLREADGDIRDRINQIYFPISGRQLKPPKMFQDPYFSRLLKQNEFVFILDRACLQFEPNNPEYQRVTSITYQYINDNNGFDLIRSTRHFGPFAFFLCWFNIIDNLVIDLLENLQIIEANKLLKLYGILQNATINVSNENSIEGVENYITNYSNKKGPLELALQSYKELEQQRIELEKGIKFAHGV